MVTDKEILLELGKCFTILDAMDADKDLTARGMTIDQNKWFWARWGRKQFGQRLLNTACIVITNATYGENTHWKFVREVCAKGGKQNTMYHLVHHFSMLCFENGWHPYGICIVSAREDAPGSPVERITSGFKEFFLKVYPEKKDLADTEQFFWAATQAVCHSSKPPSAHEIALAVASYIHKHGL